MSSMVAAPAYIAAGRVSLVSTPSPAFIVCKSLTAMVILYGCSVIVSL